MVLPISAREIVRFTPPSLDLPRAERGLAEARKAEAELPAPGVDGAPSEQARQLAADRVAAAELTVGIVGERVAALGRPVPVYHLKVVTRADRARFYREMAIAGAVSVTDAELYQAIGLAIADADPADRPEMEGIVDRSARGQASPDDLQRLARIARPVSTHPAISSWRSCRSFWTQMQPVILTRLFLLGWENGPGAYAAAGGVATEQTVGLIDDDDMAEIEGRLVSLMVLAGRPAKN